MTERPDVTGGDQLAPSILHEDAAVKAAHPEEDFVKVTWFW